MIFPFLDSRAEILSKKYLPIYKEIAWNFQTDTPIIEEGDFKIIEGIEALRVWIYKAIKTARFQHEIYSWDYGCEITNLIGKGFTKSLIVSEVKRYIEEALMINEYIEEVHSIEVDLIDDRLNVSVGVDTHYGEVQVIV